MTKDSYDLIIVGGGLVGASLAIAISGQGLRIGLLDAAPIGVGIAKHVYRIAHARGGGQFALERRGYVASQRADLHPRLLHRVGVTERNVSHALEQGQKRFAVNLFPHQGKGAECLAVKCIQHGNETVSPRVELG